MKIEKITKYFTVFSIFIALLTCISIVSLNPFINYMIEKNNYVGEKALIFHHINPYDELFAIPMKIWAVSTFFSLFTIFVKNKHRKKDFTRLLATHAITIIIFISLFLITPSPGPHLPPFIEGEY